MLKPERKRNESGAQLASMRVLKCAIFYYFFYNLYSIIHLFIEKMPLF